MAKEKKKLSCKELDKLSKEIGEVRQKVIEAIPSDAPTIIVAAAYATLLAHIAIFLSDTKTESEDTAYHFCRIVVSETQEKYESIKKMQHEHEQEETSNPE